MATNKNPVFLNALVGSSTILNNASGTTPSVVQAAGTDGAGVTNLVATSTDTASVTAILSIDDGTSVVQLGEVTIPAGAGTNGSAPAVNLLDLDQMPGLFQNDGSILLGASCSLRVGAKAAITATKEVHIYCAGGSYSA